MTLLIDQYLEYVTKYKKKYGNKKTIVLMQVGAFFELYDLYDKTTNKYDNDDILDFSIVCNLRIAEKNININNKSVVMSGFRDYSLEKYLDILQKNNYTIVVYKQDEDINRVLLGIFSTGTYFDSNETSNLSNNITCMKIIYQSSKKSKFLKKDKIIIGLSTINILTGYTNMEEYELDYDNNPITFDDIERYISINKPNEIIILYNGLELNKNKVNDIIKFTNIKSKIIRLYDIDNKESSFSLFAKNIEKENYKKETLEKYYNINDYNFFYDNNKFDKYPCSTNSFCFLLNFISEQNNGLIKKIKEPYKNEFNNKLILGNHSLKQLNIIDDNRSSGLLSSIINFINKCKTPMGKRIFYNNILNPITDIRKLNLEYNITKHLLNNYINMEESSNIISNIRKDLSTILDIDKLYRKIILYKITPNEIFRFVKNLDNIKKIYNILSKDKKIINYWKSKIKNKIKKSSTLKKSDNFNLDMLNILELKIKEKINLDKCNINKYILETNIFNKNVYENIDNLEIKLDNSYKKLFAIKKYFNDTISNLEKKRKKNNKLKEIEYCKIHKTDKSGIYLKLTKTRSIKLQNYIKNLKNKIIDINDNNISIKIDLNNIEFRKATANDNKINLNILNKITNDIIIFGEKLKETINKKYLEFIEELSQYNIYFEKISYFVSLNDIIISKAYFTFKYNYCIPTINNKNKNSYLDAKDMRHVLIEQIQTEEAYVPNDISLGSDNKKNGILLFGTNAVGKSSLIKSIGICVILAQSGFSVPCSDFTYKPFKNIYTRIIGNDNIFKGLSSFAVEMSELRTILKYSNKNTLILGDELCSGTEQGSALSIFSAGVITLDKLNAKYIFATHFHDITKIEEITNLEKLDIKHMSIIYDKKNNNLIYDRKLRDGSGNNNYGLEVCKSLDLPTKFLDLAYSIRNTYVNNVKSIYSCKVSKYNAKKIVSNLCEICNKITDNIDIHHLQYQNDKSINNYINNMHINSEANLICICKNCHQKIHKENIRYRKFKTLDGYILKEISVSDNDIET